MSDADLLPSCVGNCVADGNYDVTPEELTLISAVFAVPIQGFMAM